jgi:hypothetical protein
VALPFYLVFFFELSVTNLPVPLKSLLCLCIYMSFLFLYRRLSSGLLNAQGIVIYMCPVFLYFVLADNVMWHTMVFVDVKVVPAFYINLEHFS